MLQKIILFISFIFVLGLFPVSAESLHGEAPQRVAPDPFKDSGKQEAKCNTSDCINSENFTIDSNVFSPGGKKILLEGSTLDGSTQNTINSALSVIIRKLIIVFGSLSLLIMTIGGGYMIFHSGEESLLSRGKTIFMWGLISLAIALSSALLVQIVTYILY